MKKNNNGIWPLAFISPYFIIYFIFGLFPILFSLYLSFTDWDGISTIKTVGFNNYIKIFTTDPYFLKSIWNTIIFMALSLPPILFGGLLLAAMMYGINGRAKQIFQLSNFLPFITTPVAIGIIFSLVFDWQTGTVNKLLIQTGIMSQGINWLGEVWPARIVVSLMRIWKYTGYSMVIYLAGMSNISNDIYEAANIDGSNAVTTFFKITLPQLKPITLFLVITNIIDGLQLLDEPMLLFSGWTGGGVVGGPERSSLTAVWNLYDTAFGTTNQYGYAAAMAYGLFLFILIFSIISSKVVYRGGDENE